MSNEGGLRGMLRKAASLVVEMPPDEEPELRVVITPSERAGALKELQESMRSRQPAPGSGTPPPPPAPASAPAPATKTVEQIAREQPGPNLEDIRVHPEAAQAVTVAANGQIDFQSVYTAANVPACSFSAEQVLDMIAQLPRELPLDAKRQMVKVSIGTIGRALGVTPETVVADASRKLAAIAAYSEQQQSVAQELVARSNQAILELEAKIAERKQAIEAAQQRAQQIQAGCKAEGDRLDDILEFFSQDVPPSKYAPQAGTPRPQ